MIFFFCSPDECLRAKIAKTQTVKLPAHFLLWMTSPEARFLRGKFAWANWDVVQLKMRAKEIEESQMLTSNVLGWPYSFE